jgi:ATP-binding cassette, subfamily B, multidrug efflux pump
MLIRLLRTHLRPYTGNLILVVVLQLVGTMAALYLPSLNADIIDNGIAKGDTGYILEAGGWMLLFSLLQGACWIGAVYFGARTAAGFSRDVRAAVFHRVGDFSAREMARFGAPTLISRNSNDVQQIQMLVLMTCTMLVSAPISMVGGVIMALQEDVGLSWLVVVAVPVLALSIGLIARRMVPQFRKMQTSVDSVNRVLREQIGGIRVVRAFVREPHETERFGAANTSLTQAALSAGRLMALTFPVVMLILNLSTIAVLWFGAGRVEAGKMQVGALTAFMAYLLQILFSVMMATFVMVMLPRAAVSADRIGEVLETEPSVRPPAEPVAAAAAAATVPDDGTVVLENVEFQYPGAAEPVLRGVSLTATPGTTTALIGSTGAGKTTLLSLIPRLYDVTAGTVKVGGTDVRDLDPDVLWSRIGLVPQKPYLFSGTVASNLRYGNPDATDDDLWEALTIAQARDFVEAMPDGLDAPISQGGTNVSGGQRQRLAIARALVRKPGIYLFDDSFSALDLATDARLRAALAPVTRNATVLVVAQRVSTIAGADRIVVLEDGEVVGTGTHHELLAGCPTYREIVASQQSLDAA